MLVALAACGKQDSGNSGAGAIRSACTGLWAVGNFHNGHNDELKISEDCSGTTSTCGYTFSFTPPADNSDAIDLQVSSSAGGSSCLSVGTHRCHAFMDTDFHLVFWCDWTTFGTIEYWRDTP